MAITTRRAGTAMTALAAAVTALSLVGTPAVAATYASSAGPWSAAASLTGADGQQSLMDVKVASDGTAFALWRNKAAGESTWDFDVVVRPAGSSTWGAAHTLATGRAASSQASLVTSVGGEATVAWVDGNSLDGSLAILGSTWHPASASWSQPAAFGAFSGTFISEPSLAAAADGSLTAVWEQADDLDYQVMTATRAAGAQTWSAPQPLDSPSYNYIYNLAVAESPDGTATAVWNSYDLFTSMNAIETATRASATSAWGKAAVLPGSDIGSNNPQVAMSATGATTVLWRGAGVLMSSTRKSPAGSWAAPQTAVPSFVESGDSSDPLVGPNGDVTFVWTGWSSSAGTPVVHAVTRTASTGAWSSPATLSTGYAIEHVSASIGADGTVQVLWPQTPSIDDGDDNYLEWAVRANGSWSKAVPLSTTPVAGVPNTDALAGDVAAGPDGRATAVWTKAVYVSPGSYTSQLWSQSQTLLAKPVITSAAKLAGTARTGNTLSCSAAWSGSGVGATYAWLRDGWTVAGATSRTYHLAGVDHAQRVACRVTVANRAGSVSSTSAAVTVAAGAAPKATKAPVLSGSRRVGGTLSVSHGTWSPTATSYTYAWKRNGKVITGRTKSTYVVAKADHGKKITVTVTAHRAGYTNGTATTSAVTGS